MKGFSSKRIVLKADELNDRQIYSLKARPCIFQPGNFTDWGSDGVNKGTICGIHANMFKFFMSHTHTHTSLQCRSYIRKRKEKKKPDRVDAIHSVSNVSLDTLPHRHTQCLCPPLLSLLQPSAHNGQTSPDSIDLQVSSSSLAGVIHEIAAD